MFIYTVEFNILRYKKTVEITKVRRVGGNRGCEIDLCDQKKDIMTLKGKFFGRNITETAPSIKSTTSLTSGKSSLATGVL
jgi:hypothetical protein